MRVNLVCKACWEEFAYAAVRIQRYLRVKARLEQPLPEMKKNGDKDNRVNMHERNNLRLDEVTLREATQELYKCVDAYID